MFLLIKLGFALCLTPTAQGQVIPQVVRPHYEFRLQKSTVIVGEPIFAEFVAVNTDKKNRVEFTPHPFAQSGKVRIIDEAGKPVKALEDYVEPHRNFISDALTNSTLRVGEENKTVFVANRLLQIRRPGKYRIQFEAYQDTGDPLFGFIRDHSKSSKVQQELTITVKPVSVYRLQRMADKWLDQAFGRESLSQSLAIDALFSMPEDVVGDYWRKLANGYTPGSESSSQIKKALYRLQTSFTRGLLEQMGAGDLVILEAMQAKAKAEQKAKAQADKEAQVRKTFLGLP